MTNSYCENMKVLENVSILPAFLRRVRELSGRRRVLLDDVAE